MDGTIIDDWDWTLEDETRLLTGYAAPYYGASNNGTKSNPNLCADILGDWREELILRDTDSTRLMVFSTALPTSYRFYTFMHDPVYRLGVAWQNVGYNQPAHTGFYMGADMDEQPPANIRTAPVANEVSCWQVK